MKSVEQIWRKAVDIYDPAGNYNGFHPSVTVLPAGYCHREGYKVLECPIVWERDQAVLLRDNTTIYTDIFRPEKKEKVPGIISWSPYGKSNIDQPWAYDSPELSHLQKEEGVDPALWCKNGYAVAHPDSRGSYMSEGNVFHWGHPEGSDIYDYVEWLAAQEWCNGKVGMAGNSYLSIVQWFAAAERPPHLTAIAPWEGQTDAYREVILQGGIADVTFPRQAVSVMHGKNYIDDMPAMAEKYPLMNEYWADKRAELDKIQVPAYIVASYTNPIHTPGTFRGYREIASKEKWLRVHNSTEWVDFYTPAYQEELMKFFDHYLKQMNNDWEKTPKVRYSVLNPGHRDEANIEDTQFPPTGTEYVKLYLDGENHSLTKEIPRQTQTEYDGKQETACAEYRITFEKETTIIGYPSVKLFVEGKNCKDMDLFVDFGKERKNGERIPWDCTPHNRYFNPFDGFEGRLRVSLRELDKNLSTDIIPVHKFCEPKYLMYGEITEVSISIRPTGIKFEAGETLIFRIGNESITILKQNRRIGLQNNGGRHVIHCGGDVASYLQIPVVQD